MPNDSTRFGLCRVISTPLHKPHQVIPLVIFVLSLKQVTYFSRFYLD